MSSRTLDAIQRFIVAAAVLAALGYFFWNHLGDGLVTLFRWELGWLDHPYRVLFLGVAQQGSDTVIRIDVTLASAVKVGAATILPDPRGHAQVTTPLGHAIQPAILFFAVLAAWPAAGAGVWRMRLPVGLPVLLLVVMLDLPLVLLADLWEIFLEAHAPHDFSILVAWKNFLEDGGRFALALTGAAFSVRLAEGMSSR